MQNISENLFYFFNFAALDDVLNFTSFEIGLTPGFLPFWQKSWIGIAFGLLWLSPARET